ncbi:MAG: histidine triad nucleotide-binding protein [Micromonosporaceae bacterium]|nr:histidine triad nucleotide-binding protein [Micromonosporaceae bacterium]
MVRVTNPECLFCRIVRGEIPAAVVYSTDQVLAFRDISPKAPVHVLVIPRDHHSDLASLAGADPALAGALLAAVGAVAEVEGVAESGYRTIFNSGRDGGQEVPHVHAHVLGGARLPTSIVP